MAKLEAMAKAMARTKAMAKALAAARAMAKATARAHGKISGQGLTRTIAAVASSTQ